MYNYHTHTRRCNHATDEDKKYVEAAIKGGIDKLGFSDHAPYVFPGAYESHFRMRISEIDNYIKSIEKLKEEYKNDIEIHVGFELEYYPKFHEKEMEFLNQYPYEYLILGQHFVGNEYDEISFYSGNPTKNEEYLKMYANQVIEGMNTGGFLYVAHPDLINFTGDKEKYRKEIGRICTEAKKLNIPLEFNMLGYMQGRNYPNDESFSVIKDSGCEVVIGYDAHKADVLSNILNYEKCVKKLAGYNIKPICDFSIL